MRGRLSADELALLYDESREKRPLQERAKWLDQRLAEQVEFAYRNAPAAKDKLEKAGVAPSQITTVKDLERLPVTPKGELVRLQQAKPPFGGFVAVSLNALSRIYVSPGPIYDAWGDERIKAQLRAYLRAGCPRPGDVVLVSLAYHMVPAGLFLTDVMDLMGCTVVPAGTGQSELQVKLLHDLRATAFLSFPSFTMTVLEKAEEMGYDVRRDLNLKYVVGGGERHGQILKAIFRDKYGLIVGDGYGTSDVGPVAYDCGEGLGYHYDDEQGVIEIVDPDTGKHVDPFQTGEIVVTPFSHTYPLVRFGTGDLAAYTDEVCPCGRTSPRITRILGMIGEHVRVKGMFVHLRELEEAMASFPEVSNYQMVVRLEEHRDRIVLNVEVGPGIDRQALSAAIARRCQDVFKLKMDRIEFLAGGTLAEDCQKLVDTRWNQVRSA
jgi:phenylacetate-CoA ligase